jgi:hypothetical protein
MATIQEAIKRLRYIFTSEGADQVAAALNKVGAAQGNIAATSATTEKAALSLESKFASLERRFNTTIRAQQDFEKVQKQVNAAVAQNPALQDRANVVLALAQKHYAATSQGGVAYSRAMEAMQAQAAMLSGRLGVLGTALTSLGPAGIAVAATIGAAAISMKLMSDAALQLADRAGKLKDFSETTGFTVIQLQALEKVGAQVGVTAESVNKGLERFSVAMEAAKQSSGPLYEALLRVNPALAGQIARTDSLAEAWDLLAIATRKADLEQRNFIARQAFGRGGIEITRLLGSTAQAGGLKGLIDELRQVDLITTQQAERWDTLGDKINEKMKAAKQNIDATFTGPTLEAMLQFSGGLLEISRIIRDTDWSKLDIGFQGLYKTLTAMFPLLNAVAMSLKAIQSLGLQQAPTAGSSPLQLTVTPGGGDRQAQADAAKKSREEIIRQYNEMQRWMSVVGSAATVSQQLELRQRALAAAYAEGKIPLDKYKQAYSGLMDEFKVNRIQAMVAALGSAATITEQYQAAVARLQQQLSRGDINKETFDRAIGGMERERQIQTMRDTISVLGPLAGATDEYKLHVAELEQMLAQGRISQETFNLAVLAANPAFMFASSAGKDFIQTFASGILDGKDAIDALITSLDQLAKKLLSSGIDDLFKGAVKGAVTGDWTQAVMGGVQVIGAFLIDLFADETKAQQEAKKKLQEAQQNWAEMQDQFRDFISAMNGEEVGSLTSALRAAEKQMRDFVEAALKAQDYAAAREAQEAFQKFRQDQINEFKATWEAMLQAFDLGLGLDNPFVTAAQKVRDLAKQLKGFITDAQTAFTIILPGGQGVGSGKTTTIPGGPGPEEIARATAAVREYLITLIGGGTELSETQTRLMEIHGIAQQLSSTLVELGMSATEAAEAISKGVTQAIANLRTTFETDLQREINDVSGLGYLNEVSDLIAKRNTRLADAQLIGADKSLVDEAFTKSVQKVIDDAGLVGDRFNDLFGIFPDLAGSVHESTKALQDQIDEQKRFQQTIMDFIAQMRGGELSTLSPDKKFAEAQRNYERQIVLAQSGDEAAKASITSFSQTYLEQARSFLGPSQAYGAIFDRVEAQLMTLVDGLSRIMGGGVGMSAAGFEQMNQMAMGGIVGRLASGGMIGNGIWNVDSVRARYAGGGDIMLAGGEFVTRAPSVTPQTLPVLDHISRTGSVPANDNRELIAEIRSLKRDLTNALGQIAQIQAAGNDGVDRTTRATENLRTDIRQSVGETKIRAGGK